MIKKAIHHFSRVLVLSLEIVGFLGLLLFLGWCGLIWRLSEGPLNVDFLTDRLETELNRQQTSFRVEIGASFLVWGGSSEPFEVELRDVRMVRPDGMPVLSVRKVGVHLSKRGLIMGQVRPKLIKVYGPALRVMRWPDGHFTLNLGELPAPVVGPPLSPEMTAVREHDKIRLVHDYLDRLRETGPENALLGGLQKISIYDAAVFYEDLALDVVWVSRSADVSFSRGQNGLLVQAVAGLDVGGKAPIAARLDLTYGWETQDTRAILYFNGLVPAQVAGENPKLAAIAGIDLPLKGSLVLDMDASFAPVHLRYVLGADPGTVDIPALYKQPLPVSYLYMKGNLDPRRWTGKVDQAKIDLGGPRVEASASVALEESGARLASAQAVLHNMPLDDLHRFWPETLATDAQQWVTQHLSKGIATRATLDIALTHDAENAEKPLALRRVGGEIDFTGITVDYFPPLKVVTQARGRARFDHKSFQIDVTDAKLEDMTIDASKVSITGIDTARDDDKPHIDITASLKGPLKTALDVLDSKPLAYPSMLGIRPADVGGRAEDVSVGFSFPLHKKLGLDDVQVKASATLQDVRLPDMVAGLPVSGGPMTLTVDRGALRVHGQGQLSAVPLTFDWSKNFSKATPFSSKVTAKLVLNTALLSAFSVPEMLKVSGRIPADIAYTLGHDGKAELSLKGDMQESGFFLPVLDVQKQPGAPGRVAMDVLINQGTPHRIAGLDLTAAGFVLRGDIDFAQNAAGEIDISRAVLRELVTGQTDVSVVAENRGASGYRLQLSGRQLDASPLFRDDDGPNSDAAAAVKAPPLDLTLDVDRLIAGPGRHIDRAKMILNRNAWQRIDRLEMDGVIGGKDLYVRYVPEAGGGRSLRFEADNAGAALSVLGITRSIRGGKLVVSGKTPAKGGPRDLQGTATLSDFALRDAPVLAKLLNAMSLPGMLSLLGGDGLSFKRARAGFTWTDRGQPGQTQNVRLIRLRDGQTSGASLGLTFEGQIDQWKKIYDLDGTIIPVSDLNKLISNIPIVGDVLTAGGEGFIAATYTIKGPQDQPTVMVNPLAVLAPGILRKIFFEN